MCVCVYSKNTPGFQTHFIYFYLNFILREYGTTSPQSSVHLTASQVFRWSGNTRAHCPQQNNQECIFKKGKSIPLFYCTGSIIVGGGGRTINGGVFVGEEGGGGGLNIQIVAIKHMYVHFKCTASELHIMCYLIYKANNRLSIYFLFLLREKPQWVNPQWTPTYRSKWKMNTCMLHLTLAAGYWFFRFFFHFLHILIFFLFADFVVNPRVTFKVQTRSKKIKIKV